MKKFLILGYPRSGTSYTALAFHKIGLYVNHERDESVINGYFGGDRTLDGLVTGLFIRAERDFDKYGVILHQTRHPLQVIGSAKYMAARSMADLIETCGLSKNKHMDKKRVWWVMRTWLAFTEVADSKAAMRFQVEELPKRWWRVCQLVGMRKCNFPQRLPTYVNTYVTKRRVKKLRWENLFDVDYKMATAIQERTREYGYELEPPKQTSFS